MTYNVSSETLNTTVPNRFYASAGYTAETAVLSVSPMSAVCRQPANVSDFTKHEGKNLVREKLPKTVYCKLHICFHTRI